MCIVWRFPIYGLFSSVCESWFSAVLNKLLLCQVTIGRNLRPGPAGIPGTIIEQLGSVTFVVCVQNGQMWKCHIDHIKALTIPKLTKQDGHWIGRKGKFARKIWVCGHSLIWHWVSLPLNLNHSPHCQFSLPPVQQHYTSLFSRIRHPSERLM